MKEHTFQKSSVCQQEMVGCCVCVRGEDIKHWHFVILQNGVELLSSGNKDAAAVTVIPVSSLICIVAKGAASRMVAPGL